MFLTTVLTAVEKLEDIVNIYKAGAEAYVFKPNDFSEVETAINNVMDGKKYYQQRVAELLLEKINVSAVPQDNAGGKASLTVGEIEITKLICEGLTSAEIAVRFFITSKTVKRPSGISIQSSV